MGSALQRRNFLLKAFHPYGHQACIVSNMVPASVDVMEKELDIAEKVFLPIDDVKRVFEYAGWYMEAVQGLVEGDVEDYDRDLQEDLVAFYLAMRAEEDR